MWRGQCYLLSFCLCSSRHTCHKSLAQFITDDGWCSEKCEVRVTEIWMPSRYSSLRLNHSATRGLLPLWLSRVQSGLAKRAPVEFWENSITESGIDFRIFFFAINMYIHFAISTSRKLPYPSVYEEFRLLRCGAVYISVHTRSTRRHIPEDGILHSDHRENLKSYSFCLLLPRLHITIHIIFVT
jgi:hypothetical protein